ncbi:efflux RND transporter periplasmic adaptor subunit [Pedomonas mirosovicensis]|uniref:efflux RND transporter periplasmic adaptor subunit n=1 Tax=Pedomonas mirosovicensis TaxID=2908641 RepID=UPI00216A6356|nr:HlyD family secretion protein [Pedomonas mirosovicensis]MCH8685776.1 HlyD family secretion protein [Pedomonas mirosovicensis]
MKSVLPYLLRVGVTLGVVAVAGVAVHAMWVHYEVEPWTRDGRVRADVVKVAADVSGLVTQVLVRDNQTVHRGDPLFVIDPARYHLALAEAEAAVATARANLNQARREAERSKALGDLVSREEREQSLAKVEVAEAALKQARAAVDAARLNLERTTIRATVNGTVTNLQLRPGDFLSSGAQALALVDADSLHVDGYFEETKLPLIHVGDRVEVMLMGEDEVIEGRVESIAAGIEDRDRTSGTNQLPNVNPTFNWVRLAQRVPVRVELTRVPQDVRLIAGRTATVTVVEHSGPEDAPSSAAAGKDERSAA